MRLESIPVIVDGAVQLYDMYVDGKWHGSRRTLEQCRLYFNQL